MALEQQRKLLRDLPLATVQYLYDLVVGGQANNATRETIIENPDGRVGSTVKYGSERGLAPGAASRARDRALREPGRYRIVRHMHNAQSVRWLYAEHYGGAANNYRYFEIALPACTSCHGTSKVSCMCEGTGFRNPRTRIVEIDGEPVMQLQDLRKCPCRSTQLLNCPKCWPVGLDTPKKYFHPDGPLTLATERSDWGI